jgi:hypothetical protein
VGVPAAVLVQFQCETNPPRGRTLSAPGPMAAAHREMGRWRPASGTGPRFAMRPHANTRRELIAPRQMLESAALESMPHLPIAGSTGAGERDDGSKTRDVLKRPDWLREVKDQVK